MGVRKSFKIILSVIGMNIGFMPENGAIDMFILRRMQAVVDDVAMLA